VNVAALPLNHTFSAPVNAVPVMTTVVPTGPDVGEKLLIFGLTRKSVALVADPPGVVTPIRPVRAPDGTFAVIVVSVSVLIVAGTPYQMNRCRLATSDAETSGAVGLVAQSAGGEHRSDR